MKVVIKTIPHEQQRYPTCGDYFYEDGALVIQVSDLGDELKESLIVIHELVELMIVKKRGLPMDQIDAFDEAFEKARVKGNTDEPGDDPACPYRREHCIATGVERMLAGIFNIDWKSYEQQIDSLHHPMDNE